MNRKHSHSSVNSSSSSSDANLSLHRIYNNQNDSSSSELSSDYYGYPTERLIKITKPPSYASMQHTSTVLSSTPSIETSETVATHTQLSSIYEFITQRKTSIYGPTQSSKERTIFLLIICLMTICGSNNDFLGKLCYQSLPGPYSGYIGLQDRYWIAWLLTFGTFGICAIAIIFGWEKGKQWNKFTKQWKSFLSNLTIAGSCDVWVNGGRYIGLVFLPAAVVTILKNGLQLLFSALFRKIIDKKTLSNVQTFGILLVVIGLILVCIAIFLSDNNSSDGSSIISQCIGVLIMITVGFFGSLRNHYEQILCRDMEYNSNFVVGIRSFVSIFWTLIIAIILLCIPNLYYNKFNNYITSILIGWTNIYYAIIYICSYPVFIIGFVLFLCAIYGKNITQMKVIELSSALTRNLTMQLMPIGTWLLSLICYYCISKIYGAKWDKYSYIQLIGFMLVLLGSYIYMKIPKNGNNHLDVEYIKKEKALQTLKINSMKSNQSVDLYGTDIIPPITPSSSFNSHEMEDKI